MLDQQDGYPFLAQRAQQIGERELFRPAQAGGRLVEHDQRRIGGKRAGDFEDALAAKRQLPAWSSGLSPRPTRLS